MSLSTVPPAVVDAALPAPRRRPRVSRRDYAKAGLWVSLVFAVLVWTVPLVFMVFTSLKSEADIFGTPAFVPPWSPEWGNYVEALDRGNLLTAGANSLIIAVFKVPIGLMISAAAAFALSRLKFRRQRLLMGIIAMGAMVPIQVAIAPLFQVINGLDLLSTHIGVILPYIAFGLPYQTFILYGFFRSIPEEIDESARIDGAGNWRIFLQIILPLSKPALAALFILDFVATWNEYSIALALLQSQDSWTIPLAIQGFQSQFTSAYGPLNAFTIMSVFPVLIVYLLFQRYFVEGAFAGAVKG
ncbi:carbohydrate ABC transporter permease [Microbacterium aurantiacum]|uniref:Carbohydrate ABC transporter permease n=1 Tax=Microbacterium aurantiacum TaxID=162393 RepID=A0ABT8FPX3_9MICO|nr:carbohydrate ABC transporter permease [Microbacterium aurantiacum]MDN4463137.1 carbohydrate ABC transporter permease [Microbacterium aurantiacum]